MSTDVTGVVPTDLRDLDGMAVGIDVGGTKIASLRVDGSGTVLARDVRPTPADDEAQTLNAMVASARAVFTPEVVAIGIAAAGLMEWPSGVMKFSPNIAWRDEPLLDHAAKALGVPVVAENDATAATWGEFLLGSGRGFRHVLFVGVGTGIGGGMVIDGALFRGAHGFAAEIGHIIVEPGGPPCGCGNQGCWEQVASGSAVTREGRAAVTRHPHSLLAERSGGDPERVTGVMVTEAARDGDPVSQGILMDAGRRLGEGIAGLVNILDPEVVIVGGGASEAGDLILDPVRSAYSRSVEAVEFRPEVPIVVASLGNDAGAVGAALMALETFPGAAGT